MDRLMVEKARVNSLVRAFVQREAAIGIIGLGYVGLPLMLSACRSGHTVVGFDIDHEKVKNLNQGKSPLAHIGDNNISRKVLDDACSVHRHQSQACAGACRMTPEVCPEK